MAQIIPLVRGDTLAYQRDKQDYVLAVGTPDWYAWLTTASTFASPVTPARSRFARNVPATSVVAGNGKPTASVGGRSPRHI